MLILSPRHRPEDLELWAELEAADMEYGRRFLKTGRAERSLAAVREFSAKGRCYASVSWGKDSVTLAHLLRIAAPAVPLVNLRCSNRNPCCDDVRDAYFTVFPGQSYYEITVDYSALPSGLSDPERDRETDRLWKAGFAEAGARWGDRYLSGVRAGEGRGRLMRCARWDESTKRTCAPLAWWATADVFAYLAHHGLPVHPSYAMLGGGRWPRERIRTAEIGDTHGKGGGRAEWEREYYGDVLRRLDAGCG